MVPSRNGPKGAEIASFGLAILIFVLTPTQIGYQDLAALMAQQPAVAARWREHLIASPFGTIHAATFSLPRPIGTAIPEPPLVRLASLSASSDVTGSIGVDPFAARRADPQVVFPDDQSHRQGRPPGAGRAGAAEPAHDDEPARRAGERPEPIDPAGRPKAAEIDHTDDELPDAQTVVLAEIARDAHRRNAPARQARRDRGRDAFRAVSRIRHLALARTRSEDRDRGTGRSRRPRSDRVHAECAAEPRRPQRRGEGDAALFRQRPVRHLARRHQAVGERRGAGADGAAHVRRSRHEADRAGARDRGARRDRRRQGRSDRRRTSARRARPSGSASPGRSAPRPKSVSPMRSISKRAASRCAARSRSRRW